MLKKCKDLLLSLLKKSEKAYHSSILAIMTILTLNVPTYAAAQPKLVSGTVALFQSITTWLLIIIPVGAGAVLGYHALQKSLSDDQAVIAEKNKLMKNVLIGAAVAETASGLVTIILGFYK